MENNNKPKKQDFEAVYEMYYFKVLYYLIKKVNSREDAEDLASEIFIYCFNHYESFDPQKSAVSTWVFLITNSRLKNYYRDKKDYTEISEVENFVYNEEYEMERAVFLEQFRNQLAEKLDNMPERQKKLVIMRYFNNMEYEDIAKELDISEQNARTILSRTIKNLESQMQEFADYKY